MDQRFPLLLACFFLSGFAALLYQTAWTRELSFVFGTSDLAVAAVLAAYMGGLALGAAAAARFAMRLTRPVLAYGILELAIAFCALLVPWAIRGLNALYVSLLGGVASLSEDAAAGALAFQLAAAFAVLLPPTALMGATLPLLARHAVHREEEIASRVGVLYAVNTAGAIAGTLCAAFWLMPELGLRGAVWVGAALNGLVFALAAWLARSAPLPEPAPSGDESARTSAPGSLWILPAIALSGVVSFSYEVLWTRLLGQLLGASIHAFATMLASFLIGIALGSAVAARLAATRERARIGFALSQLGIALTSYLAFSFADQLPALSQRLGAGPSAPMASVAVAIASLLPITLCIGATFPFAVRVLTPSPQVAASATARVYAWNTVGAIVGSLAAGFLLLPGLGFEGTLTFGVAVSLTLAIVASLAAAPRRWPIVAAAGAAVLALVVVPVQPPWQLLVTSPMSGKPAQGEVVHYAVGRTTTVMLFQQKGRFQLTTDGLPESRIDAEGMLPEINVAQWLGVLPALLRPHTKDLLVVGLGGGVTLELTPSTYERIDVIELEPEVLDANRWLSGKRARDPLSDPRTNVHLGDARGTLQLLGSEYGAIVSQPSHPWTAGASHLYTREFFSLVRSRLRSDGVFVQWIGIRYLDEPLLKSVLSALLEAFPHVTLFRPKVYGLLFVASGSPIDVRAAAEEAMQVLPEDAARLGLLGPEDIVAAWALDEAGVRALAEGTAPNTDDHNVLAARSSRLGADHFDAESLRPVLSPLDPLQAVSAAERLRVIRALLHRNRSDRAEDLALTLEGADEETALGWVALRAGRTGRAARHFARARKLDPEHRDAMDGLILSRKLELLVGELDLSSLSVRLDRGQLALIDGWRASQAQDWERLAALDADLAAIEPGRGIFEAAARQRISLRLNAGDPESARETLALTERLLLRSWSPLDAMLRARGAIMADEPRLAWGVLRRLSSRLTREAASRDLARNALQLATHLPEGPPYDGLRAELKARAAGAGPRKRATR